MSKKLKSTKRAKPAPPSGDELCCFLCGNFFDMDEWNGKEIEDLHGEESSDNFHPVCPECQEDF